MTVDFLQLAPPDIIENLDYESIFAARKESLIAKWPASEQEAIRVTLSRESEPLTKLLQEQAYRELMLRNRINKGAQAVLLAFATGTDLDHLAANFNVTRLVISPANNSIVPPVPAVMELDDELRQRVLNAFDQLSVAGPRLAYVNRARSADGRVADASAISPTPCNALITVLQHDTATGEATPELLGIVANALNDELVRPIGDRVIVQSASIVNYSINARLYVKKLPENGTLLDMANSRVATFINTPRRLGRSVYLSVLYSLLQLDGVTRVQLLAPTADILVTEQQAANCTSVNVVLAVDNG